MLRNRVTSPGGVTAAGLYELEKGGLRATLCDAVYAAVRVHSKVKSLNESFFPERRVLNYNILQGATSAPELKLSNR